MSNWNLNNLFDNLEEWQSEFTYAEKTIDEFASYKGKLSNYDSFLEYFTLQKEFISRIMKVYLYAFLLGDLDKRNTENDSRFQSVTKLFSNLSSATAFEEPELLDIGKETVNSFVSKSDLLKEYSFNFDKLFRKQKHVLDEKRESLLANFSQLEGSGSSLYSALALADIINKDIELSNGEILTITQGNFRSYLTDLKDPEDRKKVFEAAFSHYKEHKSTYASIYNTVLQRDLALMKSRDYSSCLESYLFNNFIPTDVYYSLVNVARNNTQPIKRYNKLRKKHLNLDKLHTYDRFLPLASGSNNTYTYEDAKDLFFKSIEKYPEDFKTKARESLAEGFVDVYETEGKQTGAYSSSVINNQPYILLNYDDTLNYVFTVAHEAGHSMHSLFAKENQPTTTQKYTIFVAEIASTFNEHNLLDFFIKNHSASKEEKIILLQQSIDDILGTFYRQTLFATFELEAHKLVENGHPITHEALSKIMIDLYKEYYDIDITLEDGKEFVWSYIPHFFYYPFYVYQYATSFAASLKIYEDVKNNKENAFEKYIDLLKSGGSDYPVNQVKKAGVDLTKEEPFKAVVKRLNDLIDELELALNE